MIRRFLTAALACSLMLSMGNIIKINTTATDSDKLIITLDPGHGKTKSADGSTGSGANGAEQWGGVNEYIYNWKISNYCKERLELYNNVTVYMTKSEADTTPGLEERVDIAVANGSDAIISIHNNSFSKPSANGCLVFIPNNNYRPDMAKSSADCANIIANRLINDVGIRRNSANRPYNSTSVTYPDGSVADHYRIIRFGKEKGLNVAMIVECCFQSNETDVKTYLLPEQSLKQIGCAIADGIAQYYGLKASTTLEKFSPIEKWSPETSAPVTTAPTTTAPTVTSPMTDAPVTTALTTAEAITAADTAQTDAPTEDVTSQIQTEALTEQETATDTDAAPSESEEQTAPDTSEDKSSDKKGIGAVIGIIAGAVVATAAIATAIIVIKKKR